MCKFKKVIVILLFIIMLTSILGGCGEDTVESIGDSNSLKITDSLGRVVTLEKVPEKIVSSYYLTSSLLLTLGAEEKLVGIEGKASEREMYKKIAPDLISISGIGNSKSINVEECLSLGAELVIIPTRLKDFIPQFEKLDIPVLTVNPETLEGFMETIKIVSKSVGKEERGKELIKYYEDTKNKIIDLTTDVEEKQKVYIAGSDSVLKTCTSKMYQNYLIELCGAINVTSSLTDGYWANISVEELIKHNPEKIFLVGYATYSTDDVLNDPKLSNIDAVKNKEVYVFPSRLEPWDYPTPSSVLGMLWLVNNLYPEIYPENEYRNDAIEFFETFYDIEVSEEEIGL